MSAIRPRLEVLSPDQMRAIHLTALRVLDEVGMIFPDQECLEYFDGAGARVNFEEQHVRIPPYLVESALKTCPSSITWHARNPANTLVLDDRYTHFSAPDSAINIIDLENGRRAATRRDGEDICRLCDALPHYAIVSTGITPPELPGGALEAWHTFTSYTQSSKPVMGLSRSAEISQQTLRMAEIIADACAVPYGQLPLVVGMNPVSPLFNTPEQLEGALVYLKHGLPMLITPQIQAGATGPATLAGALVQQNAEFLAHTVLSQLIYPGVPVIYGCVSSVFDMKTMVLPYGAVESDLLAIATVQLARYYSIPSRTTGGTSDANALGMQAGVDSLMSILTSLLAGASYVLHGGGELENTLAVSLEKIVIDDEIIAMARRFTAGIDVTPETLGFDVIKEIGPQGHYLETDHTMDYFRKEQYMPELTVRDKYDLWEAGGGKRMEERARDRVHDLLSNYEPEPLPEEAMRELQALYASALKAAGVD